MREQKKSAVTSKKNKEFSSRASLQYFLALAPVLLSTEDVVQTIIEQGKKREREADEKRKDELADAERKIASGQKSYAEGMNEALAKAYALKSNSQPSNLAAAVKNTSSGAPQAAPIYYVNNSSNDSNSSGAASSGGKKREKLTADRFKEDVSYWFTKLVVFIGLIFGSTVVYATGLFKFNIFWFYGIVVGLFIIVLLITSQKFRSSGFGKIIGSILMMILILGVLGIAIFGFMNYGVPLAKAYAKSNPQVSITKVGAEATAKWDASWKYLDNYANEQIACAAGNCPEGEVEGEYVGMTLSAPELYLPNHEFKLNETISTSAKISGENLRIYNESAIANCTVAGLAASTDPETIPLADISNRERTIKCSGKSIKTDSGINKVRVSVIFPFTTVSDLKIYVLDEKKRNLMMEMWGNDFMSTYYMQDEAPVAKYNDGPVNMGIELDQVPIGYNPASKSSAAMSFAIFNRWGAYGGELIKLKNIIITLPAGIEISKSSSSEDDLLCPFVKNGTSYELKRTSIDDEKIDNVRNFVCSIKVNSMPNRNYDLWVPHIRIKAEYDYKLESTLDVVINENTATTPVAGEDISTTTYNGEPFNFGEDCANVGTSNIPDATLIAAYETGQNSWAIRQGLNESGNINNMNSLDTKALMLAIMNQETGLGTYPLSDQNSNGIPGHMAGCLAASEENVVEEISCERNTLDTWFNSPDCSSPEQNRNNFNRLDCTILMYHYGDVKLIPGTTKTADHTIYRNGVIAKTSQWRSYLCKVQ